MSLLQGNKNCSCFSKKLSLRFLLLTILLIYLNFKRLIFIIGNQTIIEYSQLCAHHKIINTIKILLIEFYLQLANQLVSLTYQILSCYQPQDDTWLSYNFLLINVDIRHQYSQHRFPYSSIKLMKQQLNSGQRGKRILQAALDNKQDLFCPSKYKATQICISKECDRPLLHCLQEQCETCRYHNLKCPAIKLKSLAEMLQKRKERHKELLKKLIEIEEYIISSIQKRRKQFEVLHSSGNFTKNQLSLIQFLFTNSAESEELKRSSICGLIEKLQKGKLQQVERDIKNMAKFKEASQQIVQSIKQWQQTILSSRQKGIIRWSLTHKSHGIRVVDTQALQTSKQRSIILMEPKLPKNEIKRWTLNIKKNHGYNKIGVCLKNHIASAKYKLINQQEIGHGCYLLSNVGFTYSHSINEQNSIKIQQSGYCSQDQVSMKYNPFKGTLSFYKNKQTILCKLSIPPPLKGESYHACALLDQKDQFQLLDEE